jgi:hypothetical protein
MALPTTQGHLSSVILTASDFVVAVKFLENQAVDSVSGVILVV